MSFGFSASDFISAAHLTYRLITALRETHGAGEEYRTTIDELGCYQTALMKVSFLERNKNIPKDTLDAASHMVMQSMDMIQSYLDQTKKYDKKLSKIGSSGFSHGVRKVRWTLLKSDDMRKLREALKSRSAGLQLLLQIAGLETEVVPSYFVNEVNDLNALNASTTSGTGSDHTSSAALVGAAHKDKAEEAVVPNSMLFSLHSFTAEQLRSMIEDQSHREAQIMTVAILLRTLVKLGKYQLCDSDDTTFKELLDEVVLGKREKPSQPIKFKDALGRKFSFPWHICKTWKGMEELIKQAFMHVDTIGPHVHEGHYDLVGPDGETILPQVWETMIQPDWTITMHMWPMPEPPPEPPKSETFPPPLSLDRQHSMMSHPAVRPPKAKDSSSKKIFLATTNETRPPHPSIENLPNSVASSGSPILSRSSSMSSSLGSLSVTSSDSSRPVPEKNEMALSSCLAEGPSEELSSPRGEHL